MLKLSIYYRPLAFLVCTLLFSYPGVATADYNSVKIAQQPQTTDIKKAADQAFAEARKLFNQRTGESFKQAIPKFQAAANLYQKIGKKRLQAISIHQIGYIYGFLGKQQKALEFLNQALTLNREVTNREGEANTMIIIGEVYSSLGKNQKALDIYNQALPIFKTVGNRKGEAIILEHIGRVYDSLGDKKKALDSYNQALPIFKQLGNQRWQAITMLSIGFVYSSVGEMQKALNIYNQALPLHRAMGEKGAEAVTIIKIGEIYDSLGEKQKALQFYNQALPLTRLVGDKGWEANAIVSIGNIYNFLGEKQTALKFYNQALPLTKIISNKRAEATILNNIGSIYDSLGDEQKALNLYHQALLIHRAEGDKRREAYALNNIGSLYYSLGEKQKVLQMYNQALSLFQIVGDRIGEANTFRNLASFQRSQGKLDSALIQIQSAINITEDLRTKITSQSLRTSYFSTVQNYYKFYIDLLMEQHKQQPSKGYNALALQVSESSRARSLLELISEANTDIRSGVDAKLLQAEEKIKQKLSQTEKHRVQLLSGKYTPVQKQEIETEIKNLVEEYENIQTQIRINSPRYAAITQPQPLTLKQIQQQVLDENTLLLEYSLGKNKSYLWVVDQTGISSYELPQSSEIEKLVKNFRNEILKPYSTKKRVAAAALPLTKILLEPIAEQLKNKRLVIVGDGILKYLPFTALATPNSQEYQPLIINHEIITLPSASTVALLRTEQKDRKAASKSIAILADPVFTKNDPRVTNQKQPEKQDSENLNKLALKRAANNTNINFSRLPFTRTEAETILKLVPKNQSLSAFDFAADREFITSNKLSEYKILHFATHGIIDSKQPELSGLVLSLFNENGEAKNGFLRLHDVFNLNLSADLVVLSACQTGLGEEIKGEGVVGLTTGFFYAGTPRVVMSLWNVNDQTTSVLMSKFYQKMLTHNLNP
ncbi:MAG: CHAT domain-containing protein, partial [Sphaerospermopsis sp. SIO1G2]|nr:CHAT domain-containing protein [Sphaerospermopsis sp. SIO1G2]